MVTVLNRLHDPPQQGRCLFAFYDFWPAPVKGTIRVTLAVTVLMVTGLVTYPVDPSNQAFSNQVLRGFEWAAVTACLIPYSTVGEGGLVSVAQVTTTIIGGFLAYAFVVALDSSWTVAFITGAFTFIFHFIGWWFRLNVTLSRIAISTFIVVVVADTQAQVPPLIITAARIVGISAGVVTALTTTILILPHSATDAVLRELHKGIECLEQLHGTAWGPVVHESPDEDTLSEKGSGAPWRSFWRWLRPVHEHKGGRILPTVDPREWHDISADMHDALSKVKQLSPATQTEAYLFSLLGMRFYLPTFAPRSMWGRCWLRKSCTLSEAALYTMRKHMQHISRVQWVLLHLWEHGFVQEMRAKWGPQYPEELMQVLHQSMGDALRELGDAFPRGRAQDPGDRWVPVAALTAFAKAVNDIGDVRPISRRTSSILHVEHARSYLRRHDSKPLTNVTWMDRHNRVSGTGGPTGHSSASAPRPPFESASPPSSLSGPFRQRPGSGTPNSSGPAWSAFAGAGPGPEERQFLPTTGPGARSGAHLAPVPGPRGDSAYTVSAGVPAEAHTARNPFPTAAQQARSHRDLAQPAVSSGMSTMVQHDSTHPAPAVYGQTAGQWQGQHEQGTDLETGAESSGRSGWGTEPQMHDARAPVGDSGWGNTPELAEEESLHMVIAHHRMYTFQQLLVQLLDEMTGLCNAANDAISRWPGSKLRGQLPPVIHFNLKA